jgi:hypothetical protein
MLHHALRVVGVVVMLVGPGIAGAQRVDLYDVTVGRIGSHAGNVFYMNADKQPPQGCAWGLMYCVSPEGDCRTRLAVILAAEQQGKKLSHLWVDLDYVNSNGGLPRCLVALTAID